MHDIRCTNPQVAGSSRTIRGAKFDVHLGTLDSQGAPYKILIHVDSGYCRMTMSPQSFPSDYESYCVSLVRK
jgi:hypothetical protein